MRTRTSIALLTALLLAMLAISGYSIQLLKGQHERLEDAVRESQAQAIALLANRVEQALLGAMRPPLLALKNIPAHAVDTQRLLHVTENFPEVEQILFLGPDLRMRGSFPAPRDARQRTLNDWLAERTALEGIDKQGAGFTSHSFLENMNGRPALFSVQRINDMDRTQGWALIHYNLDVMESRHIMPLLREFSAKHHGLVQLQGPDAPWDDGALNWPVARALPGWVLVFKPNAATEAQRSGREETLTIAVTSAVIITLIIATFAVWRELRREHALVDLRNRFVANVSHELKTPLALIRMYAETLYLKRMSDPGKQHEYHRTILREAERLTTMITTVLDFARLSQGVKPYRLTDTDLRGTVANIVEDYRARITEQGLQLRADLANELPPVAHDRHGITQILLNLMDNAVKYGADGGIIEVRLALRQDWIELAVTDYGPGIPPDDRARVRRPFQRGKDADAASGSGLGLALVEQLAQIHGARFILDSPEGHRGNHAAVLFPVHKGEP